MNLDMTYLSIQRTKMANLNTYLSYIRTGFAISAIAGNLKKIYIFLFGIIIILVSTYQYWYINDKLEKTFLQTLLCQIVLLGIRIHRVFRR